ncbi:MAG: FadR family transcriptional regulator [Deltaproteobacteria bacterium]|nr:MAG: FadR family transcriptional regulator [Deltaproteobacteria bacterium]
MFTPARPHNKTTDIIIERIRTAILEGKLRPGDRLPSEKELGEKFAVSRQTMRESLRALEHLGLITLRKGAGGGAFIVEVEREVAVQNLANYLYFKDLSITNLSELRRILEPYAARCAAAQISSTDLQRLETINRETRLGIEQQDSEAVTRSEIEFHRLIATQTTNPILILVLDFVETLLEDFKKILEPDYPFMTTVLLSHEKIYWAISLGDGETAAAEMLDHVIDVEHYLAALQQNKAGKRLWQNCLQAA